MRLRTLTLLLAGLLALPMTVQSEPSVPLAYNLKTELPSSRLPLMLVFSAEHCPYCVLMDEEFLKPMLISGEYSDKVVIRKVEVDYGSLRDFEGRFTTGSELAERYGVTVTPTVLFLDTRGRELTKRKVGIGTIDFFGGELDQSIELALQKLRRTRVAGCDLTQTLC